MNEGIFWIKPQKDAQNKKDPAGKNRKKIFQHKGLRLVSFQDPSTCAL